MGDPGETRDRLEAIRKRADFATSGPWAWDVSPTELRQLHGNLRILGTNVTAHSHDDLVFIEHSREDIPWLLGEVSRLREAVERVRNSMSRVSTKGADDEYDGGYFWRVEREAMEALLGSVEGSPTRLGGSEPDAP